MNTVEIFPWNENLETGLPDIDDQHRRLVQLINLLAGHFAYQSDLPTLNGIFDELANYAVYHFASEEAVWREALADDLAEAEHRAVHARFVGEIVRMRGEEGIKPAEEIVEEVLSFLCQWLAFHILDSDKRMARMVLAIRSGYGVSEAKQLAQQEMSGAVGVLVKTVLNMYQDVSNRTLQLLKEIAARQKVEAKLLLAGNVFDNTLESICIVDRDGLIVEANPSFCEMSQLSYSEIIGRSLAQLKSGLSDEKVAAPIWQTVNQEGHWSGELSSRAQSGERYVEWLILSAVRNEQGELINYVAVFSNVGQLILREQAMKHMAHHDALTGLPNRLLLSDRIEQALARAERLSELLIVCYLDLDGFKPINDQLGHAVGDDVLQEIARRLKGMLRDHDTVARLGGDEFVIVVGGLQQVEDCSHFLDRVLQVIREPLTMAPGYEVTASIGISVFPGDGHDADHLLQRADEAMYRAKALGKNSYQRYQPAN